MGSTSSLFYVKVIGEVPMSMSTYRSNIARLTKEKASLEKNLGQVREQISKLQSELEAKKAELARIDFDNKEMFTQIQLKIEANNLAKHKILESINTVVTGINQYL